MIPEFEKMIFDINEGINHIGVFPDGKYISGFDFIMSAVLSVVLIIAFIKIVLWSDWYEEHKEIFKVIYTLFMITEVVAILLLAIYFKAYSELLFFTVGTIVIFTVALRKEFAGLRKYLDEKFGWLL